jgi:hypothetical protein
LGAFVDRFWMMDAMHSIFRIAQMVTSWNIQHPDAGIQDQLSPATVFGVATRMKCNILCNNRLITIG